MIELEIFYDASCPFCARRANWIRKNDVKNLIRLTDINENEDMLAMYGANIEDAYYTIHGVDKYGNLIIGWDVITATLEILGYYRTLWVMGWPYICRTIPYIYKFISDHKIELSRFGI